MGKWKCLDRSNLLDTEYGAEHHGERHETDTPALPPFLALPLEIRQEVYRYFIQASTIEDRNGPQYYSEYWTYHNECFFPPLLRTCGQIHDELAPMVYRRVRLAFDINWHQVETHPGEWLHGIGRNVSHIQHCEIKYQTYHYTPLPLASLLDQPDQFTHRFAFYDAVCLLYERGDSLRVLDVSVGRPPQPDLPRSYRSPPRSGNHRTVPARRDMTTEKDSEAMRREFFPEIFYTLGLLKGFKWLERIIIRDPERQRLFSPLLPYYLRGELGFHLERVSTRADERWEYQEMGWTDGGPGFESWELVNPAKRGAQAPQYEVATQNRAWTRSAFEKRDKEVRAQPPAW